MPEIVVGLPELHPAQRMVAEQQRRYNVLCLGRRSGKTVFGIDRIVETALAGKPTAWFAPTFSYLDEPWRELKRCLRPVLKPLGGTNEVLKRLDLITGGSIKCWSLENDPDVSRGNAYARIAVDEAAKCSKLKTAWEMAIRPNLADYKGDAFFLSTPRGRNDFWEFWQRGNHADPNNLLVRDEWMSWQLPTDCNPYIDPAEILALREEVGERAAAQEVDALFLEYEGRFFGEWNEERHTCLPFDIPKHWHWFAGFDWGFAKPACFLLMASDEDGRVVVVDEYYVTQKTDPDMAKDIKGLMAGHGLDPRQVMVYADPSMWNDREADRIGRMRVEDFWAAGLRFVKANNNRRDGWANFRKYLHGGLGPGETPFLRMFKGKASNLIRTMPLQQHDERPKYMEDLDTELEDHATDSARYGLNSRVAPVAAPIPDLTASERMRAANDDFEMVELRKRMKLRGLVDRRDPETGAVTWVAQTRSEGGVRGFGGGLR